MSVTEFGANEIVSRSNVNNRVTQINNDITAVNNKFPVSVANGGTGQTSLTSGEILLGNGTSGISSTATLPVSKGGTGQTSLGSGYILLGNGTSGITTTSTLPVSKGGTGSTTPYGAANQLGLVGGVINVSGETYSSFISKVQTQISSMMESSYNRVIGCEVDWEDHGEGSAIAYYSGEAKAFILFNDYGGIGTRIYFNPNGTWQEATIGAGISLYSNSSGTSNTVPLSESSANFESIEIYFKNNDGDYNSTKVYSPNGKTVLLTTSRTASSGARGWIKNAKVEISGSSITFSADKGQITLVSAGNTAVSADSVISICKVIGYKY